MRRGSRWAIGAGGVLVGLVGGGALVAFAQFELNRFERGDVIRAADVNANFEALAAAIDELRVARTAPARLEVAPRPAAGQFGSLEAALAALDRVTVGADETVDIHVAAGEYEHAAPIEVRHPDGDRIRIVGAGATLRFTAPGDGVRVADGRRLGLLDGVRLAGAGAGSGVSASNGAFVRVGDVSITGFSRGVDASAGAVVVVETGLEIEAAAEFGVVAQRNGTVTIAAEGLVVTGGGTAVMAVDGGVVHAAGARLTGCHTGGNATYGGRVSLNGVEVRDVEWVGLTASEGGLLSAAGARVGDVARQQCLFAGPGGHIDAPRAVLSGCGAQGALAMGGGLVLSNGEVSDTPGVGVESFGGAVVFADGVVARRTHGFLALRQSYLAAAGARSLEGRNDAFRAGDGAVLAAEGAEAAGNPGIGFAAFRGGVVHAAQSVVQRNAVCHFTASSYGQVYTGGADVRDCQDCCVRNCEEGRSVCTAP